MSQIGDFETTIEVVPLFEPIQIPEPESIPERTPQEEPVLIPQKE
ncbi:MAG: hypothetical protein WD512_16500 [Candidatus Paceibacterota bacterium]